MNKKDTDDLAVLVNPLSLAARDTAKDQVRHPDSETPPRNHLNSQV
ncbi:MAG: hypothetical protein P8L85_08515 [Rubripirellula sp.]|nr:hypothetical protein [Rubripirellula sp.]